MVRVIYVVVFYRLGPIQLVPKGWDQRGVALVGVALYQGLNERTQHPSKRGRQLSRRSASSPLPHPLPQPLLFL